ncbi:hypothetical protein VP01_181g5 [Puccinia sorghi]|uniref:GAG-pre-integrase domain-containing protein n=1 Tax=Puccinia sorghi TaxID=27349 RepID=A0A0L6VE50_9BASI|nr:hypothetical protein VP01_181g5 [Puccinia sorghi]
MIGAGDGFRQAMLKTALETIPQLNKENYSIWRDKITALLKLWRVLNAINDTLVPLGETIDAVLVMLLLSKMDSGTHNNVVMDDNRDLAQKLWLFIKERFTSSQSLNRAQIFNKFLYVKFKEDAVETFVTDTKVAIKKLVDIMPSDKELDFQFVCNHLIQFNNEAKLESTKTNSGTTEAGLFSQKGKGDKSQGKDQSNNQTNGSKQCKSGYHNPKKDANHSSKNCWHLHPDKAPDWWKELQAQWKASKEKENCFIPLLTLWIELGDPRSRIILDSGASAHIFNNPQFFNHLEIGNFDSIKTGKRNATLPIKGKGLKGCELVVKNSMFSVSKENQLVLSRRINNGLFTVNNPDRIGDQNKHLANNLNRQDALMEEHEKFGHASIQRINSFINKSISSAEKARFKCK